MINLEPMTVTEVFETISLVGSAAGCSEIAKIYVRSLSGRVDEVRQAAAEIRQKPRVGFLEWVDPLFNGGHWTPELIEYAGGIDCFGSKHQPSRRIDHATITDADPDVLILALCGFDETRARQELEVFKQQLDFRALRAAKSDRVYVLDGNSYFSRPGPRLVDALELLFKLLHP